MNQTQLVRSAINIFIVVAISIALFQQLMTANNRKPVPTTVNEKTGQQIPLQMTGPKIQGVRILATDKLQPKIKQILVKNEYNVDITPYQFKGNQYWFNMVLNWGHLVIIYVLIGKYKTETNESTKKKIMIGGAVGVIGWFMLSSYLKPQRMAIESEGNLLYDGETINETLMLDALSTYELQNLDESPKIPNTQIPHQDVWSQPETKPKIEEETFQAEEQIF